LARDPYGVRPLAYGFRDGVCMAASETVALEAMGLDNFREVLPGQILKISKEGLFTLVPAAESKTACCIFENIYFGEGKSRLHAPRLSETEINTTPTIDNFRENCGRILAIEAPLTKNEVDFAIGIPGTGIAGGRSFALESGLPYCQAISDRHPQDDPRTFMTPNINEILQKVLKHFYFKENFLRGAKVVLVDDSIVRGNVMPGLIKLLKEEYGVKETHVRILCPPIDKSCYLGINTRQDSEMIASRHRGKIEEIRKEIGADSLAFLSDKGLLKAVGESDGFCLGCMINHHPPIDRRGELIFP